MISIINLLYGQDSPYFEKINDSQAFVENETKYYENFDKLYNQLEGEQKEALVNVDCLRDRMICAGQETHFNAGFKAGFLLALEILNGD